MASDKSRVSSTEDDHDDPTKKYGTPNPSNKIAWTCHFCGKVTNGGSYRMKQHLVGGFRNTKKCLKAPEHVRTEVNAYMIKKATSKVLNQFARNPSHDVGDYDEEEEEVEIEGSSSRTIMSKVAPASKRMKGPLDVLFASKQPSSQSQEVLKGRKERKGIFGASDKVCRDKACEAIARFFYDNAIPFHPATSDSFKGMVEAIGQYGPGLVPPSMYELRVPFLQKEVEATNTKVMEFKKEWAIKGCSILSDGWRDSVVQKDIVNFLVNSPKGFVFIKSVEVSEVVKDSTTLFLMLDSIVEEVGEMNVVQVVTDNASNYVKAGKLLMAKRPHLYWTPCAAHCVDLLLEDIGKLPMIKNALKKAILRA
ncbi:uncharacterized protein LOC131023504 [Salvia miltiorrhiza]|uniref:uncharacterized protein LOC131023504 n=1 Tax=Salvia miltiorrhiza TaxID=226208 RepID=UPI0025AD982D|nr:uncharacterized protein LOC131023504 [Salvia miltiorrhiza]